MSENEIKPGDVVELKSGGPKMTVDSIDGSEAWCVWSVKDKPTGETFGLHLLKKVDE